MIKQETILYLNLLLVLDFQLELLEELEKLPRFRHHLKNKANHFKKALIEATETDLDAVFKMKGMEQSMYKIMDDQRYVLEIISHSRPELCSVIKAFMSKYEEAPDAWNIRLGLKNK